MGLFFNSFFWDLTLFISTITALIIIYFKKKFTYWQKKQVPFLKPSFPFGNVKDLVHEKLNYGEAFFNFHKYARENSYKYLGIYTFTKPNILIIDPELIKNILITNFQNFHGRGIYYNEEIDPLNAHLVNLSGPKWKKIRSKIGPVFTSSKMKAMISLLVKCTKELEKNLEELTSRSISIDVKDLMEKLTTDTIGSCVFGLDCNSFRSTDSEFRRYAKSFIDNSLSNALKIAASQMLPQYFDFFRIPIIPEDVSKYYMRIFDEIIKQRKESGLGRRDFIDLFIEIEKEQEKEQDSDEGMIISTMEMAAQAFVFFMAGFETSSSTLSFCLYELAHNFEIQDKVRKEILAILKKYNGELTYNAITEMNYLDQTISETLRKYPPLSQLNRKCNQTFTVPNENLVIEKGVMVWVSLLGLHMDQEYYPDPEKFDPDRFTKEAILSRPQCVYMPFGDGPRYCIGMRFAQLQVKVGLVTMLKNHKYTLHRSTKVPLEYARRGILLKPKDAILLEGARI